MAEIGLSRVYDQEPRGTDRRFLVERLWPRGVRRDQLDIDDWCKDVAPSGELRRWFGHRADRWTEFRRRYRAELDARPEAWRPLLDAARAGEITLLYSARDRAHNNAVALRDYLLDKLGEQPGGPS